MDIQEAKLFIARFVSGEFSSGEHQAFLKWLEDASAEDLEAIANEYEILEGDSRPLETGPTAAWMEQMEKKLDLADSKAKMGILRRMWSSGIMTRGMRRAMGVAAVVLAVIASGVYRWYATHPSETLPSGLKSSQRPEELLSFAVGRGKPLEMKVLPDGSTVWLNTGSALRYPRTFSGGERTVELSGEAFFEVAKNAQLPFRVKVKDIEIEVLGTDFNVKAYEEDANYSASLLKGSVRITRGQETKLLKPGDQANMSYPLSTTDPAIRVSHKMDEERVLAWRKGLLDFDDDDVPSVMNEISRSYGVKIEYTNQNKMPAKHFSGKFARTEDIQYVLNKLEYQHIHTKIEGDVIKVVP